MNRATPRLRSLLLAGLFLAGTLGLPLTDAAVFHRGRQDPFAGVTHFEPFGANHHADHCALALPQAPSLRAPLVDGAAIATALPQTTAASGIDRVPCALDLTLLPRSRAPPHTA